MPLYDETQLKKNIKDRRFARIYLIYGNEPYLTAHYTKTIAETAVPKDFEQFNLHKFDGSVAKNKDAAIKVLSDVFESCDSAPMMSDYICIIVKDFPFTSLAAEAIKLFEDSIKNIPDTTILVFHITNLDEAAMKGDKWKSAVASISKQGVCAQLNKRGTASIISLIVSGAKKRGCEISTYDAEYLINYVSDDLSLILNELDKLCAFTQGGVITKDIIEEVTTKSVEASVFDLAKSIVNKKADTAFFILNTLFTQKTEPTIILGTLASAYTDIYRAKTAQEENRRLSELSPLFSYRGKTFRLDIAAALAKKLSQKQVRSCIEYLSEADISIKFSSKPNKLILEELTAKLLSV